MKDDGQLLERLRAHDSQAFGFLLETYSDKLFRLAMGILENEGEAEGVVQDSFLRFIEKIDTFRGDSTVGTWLYRVTYNRALNVKRSRAVEPEPVEEDDDLPAPTIFVDWSHLPEDVLLSEEAMGVIQAALATLPHHQRMVFELREQEGLSTGEVAAILDISVSAVKTRLHRARLALRDYLSTYYVDLLKEV